MHNANTATVRIIFAGGPWTFRRASAWPPPCWGTPTPGVPRRIPWTTARARPIA